MADFMHSVSRLAVASALSAVLVVSSVVGGAAQSSQELRQQGVGLVYGLDGQAKDVQQGISLLSQASEAGDVEATFALGQILLWTEEAPVDLTRARALLDEAVAAGHPDARRVLGEQLVGGWALPRDVPAGLALLQEAIAAGDVAAKEKLSVLYLYGTGVEKDFDIALRLAEEAAEQGRGSALWQVGEMVMWEEMNPAQAEALLNRAGELGEVRAWDTLAEGAMYGYLGGGKESRAKFEGYAERARAVDAPKIEVLDATRQMWGISMRASGPETVASLRTAAEEGDEVAAGFLIRLLRDGNGMNVRRDLTEAKAALDQFAEMFTEDDLWRFERTFEAARVNRPEGFAKAAESIESRPGLMNAAFARDLLQANPNVVVYMLQDDLKAQGLYRGPLDGFVGPKTLKALNRVCPSLPDNAACGDSVLRPEILSGLLTGM